MEREGDLIFLKIKFFQGAPPPSPKSVLSSGSPFYFVLLGSGTCLPRWERCHRRAMTEGGFPRGSLPRLACRLGRSWAVPTGHQDPPLHPPTGKEMSERVLSFGYSELLRGNSSSRRKVTAAAGRGRILVRGPYCLRCASEAWQWRLSFLGNRKKSRKSLKDFLLRGGAGGWRGFWRHQKSRFIIGITVPASHSA